MKAPDDARTDPRWLEETLRRIRRVDTIGRPVHTSVLRTSYLLLSAIESSDLQVPDVENFGRLGLALVWSRADFMVEITVDLRSIRQVRLRGGKKTLDRRLRDRRGAIPWIREAIEWVFPGAVAGHVEEGR